MSKSILASGIVLAAAWLAPAASAQESLADLVRAGQREAVIAAITSPDLDVDTREPDGSTALLWATYRVDHELVRALLGAGARADVVNQYGASPLAEAVKLADLELVRLLLDAGANVESPNADNQTALMLAASVGSEPIARLLLERGAQVNAVEHFRGQNALMWAAGGGHAGIVEMLIARGADVHRRAFHDDWPRQMTSEPRAQFRQTGGLTALLYATRAGCLRCAQALVKAGADVNQPNPDGVTPLINALDNRHFDLAMFLLDAGANPHVWDMSGRTPLYVAVDMNSFTPRGFGVPEGPPPAPNQARALDVARRLLDMGVDPNHELTRMRPNGVGRGRFADYMMRGGTGPLMVATLSLDAEAMALLLARGAEVDLPNVFRITPLMAAAGMSGNGRANFPQGGDVQARVLKAIDVLLDAGADINARVTDSRTRTAKLTAYIQGRDHEGKTAVFAAAESGWDRVVKHLVARGADATASDASGKTPLDYARSPAPAGPGGAAPSPAAAASRAATVAFLESLAGPVTAQAATAAP